MQWKTVEHVNIFMSQGIWFSLTSATQNKRLGRKAPNTFPSFFMPKLFAI